jgi:hypothetical protein
VAGAQADAAAGDRPQVPVVTFLLLLVLYAVVTFEKISLCVASDMQGCR